MHSKGNKPPCNLNYATIVNQMLKSVPEIQEDFDTFLQSNMGCDVPYSVFESVFRPFAKKALLMNWDEALIQRVLRFMEEMATSSDIEVVNLLWISVFEVWVGESETLAKAWRYMGEETKLVAIDAATRLQCKKNLPPEAKSTVRKSQSPE